MAETHGSGAVPLLDIGFGYFYKRYRMFSGHFKKVIEIQSMTLLQDIRPMKEFYYVIKSY